MYNNTKVVYINPLTPLILLPLYFSSLKKCLKFAPDLDFGGWSMYCCHGGVLRVHQGEGTLPAKFKFGFQGTIVTAVPINALKV